MFSAAICSLPRAEGSCDESLPRWYFDYQESRCSPFYYTGCEGNLNQFEGEEQCEESCPSHVYGGSMLPRASMVGLCYHGVYGGSMLPRRLWWVYATAASRLYLPTGVYGGSMLPRRPDSTCGQGSMVGLCYHGVYGGSMLPRRLWWVYATAASRLYLRTGSMVGLCYRGVQTLPSDRGLWWVYATTASRLYLRTGVGMVRNAT